MSSDWELGLTRTLRPDAHGFQTPLFEILSDAPKTGISRRFLEKLSFSEMDDRELNIAQAMKNTFEWIYRDPQPISMP